jgi:hypothetical protein
LDNVGTPGALISRLNGREAKVALHAVAEPRWKFADTGVGGPRQPERHGFVAQPGDSVLFGV